jgi:hypothetical protein
VDLFISLIYCFVIAKAEEIKYSQDMESIQRVDPPVRVIGGKVKAIRERKKRERKKRNRQLF